LDTITNKRLAISLIVIGILLAVDSFLGLSIIYKLWPVLILILGTGFIGIFVKRKARDTLFLVVGEYLILFSVLALYCNFTSWKNLAQMWPLFIIFFGIVFITLFFLSHKNRFILFFGLVLTFLSIFFIIVFSFGGQYWWLIFIFIGLSIYLSGISK
ncbi:hypothetical protein ACFL6H_10375, partial [Candidatus Latescibacterota bacterium]